MSFPFEFPLLSVDEMITYLQDHEFEIKAGDFQRPNSERWKLFYQAFLELLTNRSAENLMQQPILSDLEYPELYEDAIPLISFTVALRRLLCSCGIPDFSIADIFSPTTKRVSRITSAVINFHRFGVTRMAVFSAKKDELERFREQHDYLIKENDAMKQKINEIKSTRAQQEPEMIQIQEQIDKLKETMDELSKKQAAMEKDRSEVKTKIAETNVTRDNLKISLLNSKKEQDKIAQKIVHSPDRVKNEQECMKHKLQELKTSLEERRERQNQMKELNEQLESWEAETKKCLKAVQAISEGKEKEKAIQAEKTQVQDKFMELQNVLKDLNNKKDHVMQILCNREEKLAKLSLQQQIKLNTSRDTLSQLKNDKEAILQGMNADNEISNIQKEKEKIKESIQLETSIVEEKKKSINDLYSEILECIHDNHNQIAPLLKSIVESTERQSC